MKKMISFLAFSLLVATFVVPGMEASAVSDIHKDCEQVLSETISVKDIPITADMLQEAKELGVIPDSTSLISTFASCSHTYTAWTTISSKWIAAVFPNCRVRSEYQMRYCTKCNAAFAREKTTQAVHIFVGSKCQYCGISGGYAR